MRDAKQRVDEVFEAVYRCQLVTGVRGLPARGYLLGHGETYAEREASSKLRFWRQCAVAGQAFRWVGDPSHHNYSDAIHGLGQYFTLAAEGPQKERAREAIDALVSYWVDNDLRIAEYDKSFPPVPILGLTDGKTLNTRVMMAIAGAKVAHFATVNDKVENPPLMANQNQLLRRSCTGNFKDLVKAVNRDAAMMEYLDTVRNRKRQPNENYARERMAVG